MLGNVWGWNGVRLPECRRGLYSHILTLPWERGIELLEQLSDGEAEFPWGL